MSRAAGIALLVALVNAITPIGSVNAGVRSPDPPNHRLWTIVPTERPGEISDFFEAVVAPALDDAWAVGSQYPGPEMLIEHWDGRVWRAVTNPGLPEGAYQPVLSDVAAVSASDVWAIGCYFDIHDAYRSLILHWDGATWAFVRSPGSSLGGGCVLGLAVVSTDDVWAVGTQGPKNFSSSKPLIEHWDGSAWSIVPSPGDPDRNRTQLLAGSTAIGPNDVWAVGYTEHESDSPRRPLIEHWDGYHWRKVATPTFGPYGGELLDVSGSSSSDVWAVGDRGVTELDLVPLTLHFDGSSWTSVSSPSPGDHAILAAAVALSPTSAWAVGYERVDGYRYELREHWDGLEWRTVGPENSGTSLSDVAKAGPRQLWAVGQIALDHDRTQAERYGVPFCSDGADNDGDGATDYPADPGCTSGMDGSEYLGLACDDGRDNDRDGDIDYPDDLGCSSIHDRTENTDREGSNGRGIIAQA